jgi:hypothetical protein
VDQLVDISANLFGFVNKKNPNERDYDTTAVLGDKAQGKSTLVSLYAKLYNQIQSEKLRKGLLKYPKKVLIVDPTDNNAFQEFEDITLEQLMYGFPIVGKRERNFWSKGIRRIRKTRNIKDDIFINTITDCYKNGLLIIDEASEVVDPNNPPHWQKELIKKHRMSCLDLLYVFHNFMDIPLKLRPHIWCWILFRTPEKPDSVKYFRSRQFPNPEALWEKWKKVENSVHDNSAIIQHYEVHRKSFKSVFELRNKQ